MLIKTLQIPANLFFINIEKSGSYWFAKIAPHILECIYGAHISNASDLTLKVLLVYLTQSWQKISDYFL